MSLNWPIIDQFKPWLNIRVNNLKIDGESSNSESSFIVSNNPSDLAKYTTIQSAINDAQSSGQTILVRAGTYNENLNLGAGGYNIMGISTDLSISGGSVKLIGIMTAQNTSEVSISNIGFESSTGNIINSSGGMVGNFLFLSDCQFIITGGAFMCLNNVNNNNQVLLQNCVFSTNGVSTMISSSFSDVLILIDSKIGVNNSPVVTMHADNTVIVLYNNIVLSSLDVGMGGLVISSNNLFLIGDTEAYNLTDPSAQLVTANNTISSQPNSGTDWITGAPASTILSGGNVLIGRNTVAGGVNFLPLAVM